jgi:CRP/FNR family transcriptional regulator
MAWRQLHTSLYYSKYANCVCWKLLVPEEPSTPRTCDDCSVRHFTVCGCNGADGAAVHTARTSTLKLRARRTIARDGTPGNRIFLIRSGWAFRYRALAGGQRQILDIILPGDTIGLVELYLGNTAPAVEALTDVELCVFSRETICDLLSHSLPAQQRVARAFVKAMLRYEDNLVDLGRRPALERLASFIVKLRIRLAAQHQEGNSIPFPLSQRQIAEATGLTSVHVSRMLKQLGDENIIANDSKKLLILDEAALIQASALSEADIRRVTAYSEPSYAA